MFLVECNFLGIRALQNEVVMIWYCNITNLFLVCNSIF